MKIIVTANQKGGVGKSTTAGVMATGLMEKGYKVLIIDLDSQQNLSYSYGVAGSKVTALELLTGEADIEEAIVHTPSGDIIPGTSNLALCNNENTSPLALKEAIQPLHTKDYNYIIIDTPPALSILTINALLSANDIIIPALADIYSIQGIVELFKTIEAVKEKNKSLKVAGILLTQYNPRAILRRDSRELIEKLAKDNGTKLYKTTIRSGVAVGEAQISQTPLLQYATKSKVANDYRDFIKEYLKGE